MSRFRHSLSSRDSHITTLRMVIAVLVVGCGALWWGWQSAPKDLTVHVPPDLRSGSTRKWWEVPPETVYAFGWYVWQSINRWPTDGEVDYQRNLKAYSPFITSSCQAALTRDYDQRLRRNELTDRVRGMYEIPGRGLRPEAIDIIDRDHWIVKLDLVVDEQYAGTPVRRFTARYPLRVIRMDVDPQRNPWGLKIDCLEEEARRLEIDADESGVES